MSHAALVNVGLFYIVVVQPLLLVVFVWAVSRAPSGPPDASRHPEPGSPLLEVSGAELPEPARSTWPLADAAAPSRETSYVGRHATRGGPPWGPAPKPPGTAW